MGKVLNLPLASCELSSCRRRAHLPRSWLSPSSCLQLATVQSVNPLSRSYAVVQFAASLHTLDADAEVILSGPFSPCHLRLVLMHLHVNLLISSPLSSQAYVIRKDGVPVALFSQHRVSNFLCCAMLHQSCYSRPRSP